MTPPTVTAAPTHAAEHAQGPVLVVSHGYENIYERGFCNGLHDAGFGFVLVSSDQTDYRGLRPGTNTLNLRGSQGADRTPWQKAANLPGLIVHIPVSPQIARIVICDFLARGIFAGRRAAWKSILMAREQLGVVLDLEHRSRLLPVGPDGANAVRADG